MGGVEFHARRVSLALNNTDVKTGFSTDFSVLTTASGSDGWDVVQTHGSAVDIAAILKHRFRSAQGRVPLHAHTLHGTSWERIWFTRDFFYLGGWWAGFKELIAALCCDVLLSGHPDTTFFRWVRALGKPAAAYQNGWDMPEKRSAPGVSSTVPTKKPYWVFIGRGDDPVKGAQLLLEASKDLGLDIVAVPGSGFENQPQIRSAGKLGAGELTRLLEASRGLILPSLYEGYSIALVEALGLGLEVVATPVGAVPLIRERVQGLHVAENVSSGALRAVLLTVKGPSVESRHTRASHNQKNLVSWADVAATGFAAVQGVMEKWKQREHLVS